MVFYWTMIVAIGVSEFLFLGLEKFLKATKTKLPYLKSLLVYFVLVTISLLIVQPPKITILNIFINAAIGGTLGYIFSKITEKIIINRFFKTKRNH